MEQNQKADITEFITACNEFIEGRFILADIKISKILRSISTLKEVYNLIAESLINYDFQREFKRVKESSIGKGNSHLELPLDNQQIIPLVFSMLVEIDSKKMNFDTLLSSSFALANTQKEEYELFSKYVILPFRNAIAQIFGVDAKNYVFEEKIVEEEINIIDKKLKEIEELDIELAKKNMIDEQLDAVNSENVATKIEEENNMEQQKHFSNDEETNLLFSRISRMCGIIESKTSNIRDTLKKSNINLVVDALIESCLLKNKKIAVALILSLNLVAHRERVIKQELKEINNICYEFYA